MMPIFYVVSFARIVIGLTFLISWIGKIRNLKAFEQTISDFRLLHPSLHRLAALIFLIGELAVVILLIAGGSLIGFGFVLAAILLATFTAALISVIVRRIQTACNCFGSSTRMVSNYDVWRNTGFILLAGAGWGVSMINSPIDLSTAEIGLLIAAATVFVALWLNLANILDVLLT